jgi:lipopolysaccharide biosynthesis protein
VLNNYSEHCEAIEKIKEKQCVSGFSFYIHLHIYYEEQTGLIFDLVRKTNFKCFLIITISGEHNYSLYKALCDYKDECLEILYFNNYGYDVLPFLKVLSLIKDDDSIIAKIHTKPNHQLLGNKWRNECLKSVLHSNQYVKMVIDRFNYDPDLGMIGSRKLYKSTKKFMYGSEEKYLSLLEILNAGIEIDISSLGFFAGCMFWARKRTFNKLINAIKEVERISCDDNNPNQTIWHTIERVFGYLPTLNSQKIYTVDFKDDYSFVIREDSEPSVIPLTQSF